VWAKKRKHSFETKHHLGKKAKVAHRKTRKGHKKAVARRHFKRVSVPSVSMPSKAAIAMEMSIQRQLKNLKTRKGRKGAKTMKSRKHSARKGHRKSYRKTRRNPFSLKGFTKGFVQTDMLVDGALVAGGMFASKMAMDFAAGKVAFLATPIGKIAGRVVLGGATKMLLPKVGLSDRKANMVAIGVIAPAVLDLAEMILPRLGYTGGVRLLSAGYMPDVAGRLSSGYMPDVQGMEAGEFNFSE
jgi:hypothetical protein